MRFLVLLIFISMVVAGLRLPDEVVTRKDKLSEYAFFTGKISDLSPTQNIIPYTVNTPLFSNYAEKIRFIQLPPGQQAAFKDSAVFDLPVGTVLIKNFFYPTDLRKPDAGRQIIETRLLVHQKNGWEAWPYIWNDEQSEAYYDPAGESKTVTYTALNGKKKSVLYAIPNKNQCKGCHTSKNKMIPIGLTARQLNKDHIYSEGSMNQLNYWQEKGILNGHPDVNAVQRLAVWNDPQTGTLDQRARAYLDANCGHCHSSNGPASTSGLLLDYFETRSVHLGVNKTPVAAGRGAGNLKFDIVPGKPEHSILLFRMKTNDPAIAMPEIGREEIHAEGVALIEEWIRKGKF